ncbi:exonuclease [Catovirus CTV1]|uniref:Exonuclease n=1 Tax=Catovirus CTV1 TaxID=1977631 RepID=A0A1V0S938_9VIRU|nr:exonuclease [Catovirus CTV1]
MSFEKKYKDLVYVVIDVESNGPSVKKNSMFSVGGVAIEVTTKTVLGSFHFNVKESKGSLIDKNCWDNFWSKHHIMYELLHKNQCDESDVVTFICNFIKHFVDKGKKIFFASDNSVFDWKWIDTCILNHREENPLGHNALDIFSYAAGVFKEPRHNVMKTIKKYPKKFNVDKIEHNHNPYMDALQEACLLIDIIRYSENLEPKKLTNTALIEPFNSVYIPNDI